MKYLAAIKVKSRVKIFTFPSKSSRALFLRDMPAYIDWATAEAN